jgi:hypothetical protein
MIPNVFHLKLVSEAYKIKYRAAVWRARKLGITSDRVTNEQAFDIANYGIKPSVEVIVVYITFEIIPSRLNYTTLEDL